jgi:small subunit ribosomal protein S11
VNRKTTTRKKVKNIPYAKVSVLSTFNNTIVTFSDRNGNVICWSSAGKAGFKGSRKSTPFAGTVAAEKASVIAIENGVKEVDIFIKGPGAGRESTVRAIATSGIQVKSINDRTRVAHNGCRPRKKRRV